MNVLQRTISRYRYLHWSFWATFTFSLTKIAEKLKIAPHFFREYHNKVLFRDFRKKWLRKNSAGETYFDFNGILFPDISKNKNDFSSFVLHIFDDIFLMPCYYDDNYDKALVNHLDQLMLEGPYGYKDNTFDVTVKKEDVVIDAGAWIGDFSAYADSKGAITYAFEPVEACFYMLCKTIQLDGKKIYPIQKGLGATECELDIQVVENNTGASSFVVNRDVGTVQKIKITTLDKFVEENNLERVDFIKADIEGAERDFLRGATHVLKNFAPKLAICTYHLPDDPEVLEKIILEANPDYRVVHLKNKLFACVVK